LTAATIGFGIVGKKECGIRKSARWLPCSGISRGGGAASVIRWPPWLAPRLGELGRRRRGVGDPLAAVARALEQAHVCARAEAAPRPREDDRVHCRVAARDVHRVAHLVLHRARPRVELLGPVQPHGGDAVLDLVLDRFVGHVRLLAQRFYARRGRERERPGDERVAGSCRDLQPVRKATARGQAARRRSSASSSN
jgi:hypothetical protein